MIDVLRLLVGDTDTSNEALTDAHCAFFLSEANDNVYLAASLAADAIAAKYARDVTNSQTDSHGVHNLSRNNSDKYKHYKELAGTLMVRYKQGAGTTSSSAPAISVFAGGISNADKGNREAATDRVTPAFNRELHDYPGKSKTRPWSDEGYT